MEPCSTCFVILFIIVNITPTQEINLTGKVLEGNIEYPDNFPTLNKGSCLIVKFEDTSLADAVSKLIARQVVDNPTKDNHLYSIKMPKYDVMLPRGPNGLTVSAVLNNGWCGKDPGKKDEWIRSGDFLTATRFEMSPDELVNSATGTVKGPTIKLVAN